jgi:hypothetical protein
VPPWTPFARAYREPPSGLKLAMRVREIQQVAAEKGFPIPDEQALEIIQRQYDVHEEIWKNSRYTVQVDRQHQVPEGWPAMIELSIKRNDQEVPGVERWRDFLRIKNELVGEAHEAVELYPADGPTGRVVDSANQAYLYVLADPTRRFPFGFQTGLRVGPREGSLSRQRPFEEEVERAPAE